MQSYSFLVLTDNNRVGVASQKEDGEVVDTKLEKRQGGGISAEVKAGLCALAEANPSKSQLLSCLITSPLESSLQLAGVWQEGWNFLPRMQFHLCNMHHWRWRCLWSACRQTVCDLLCIPQLLAAFFNILTRDRDIVQDVLDNTLPTQIGKIKTLQFLRIQANPRLSGEIPTTIGNLRQLASLTLAQTSLTNFPTQIGSLTSLVTLWVYKIGIYSKIQRSPKQQNFWENSTTVGRSNAIETS